MENKKSKIVHLGGGLLAVVLCLGGGLGRLPFSGLLRLLAI
jgi:hypothetical protein